MFQNCIKEITGRFIRAGKYLFRKKPEKKISIANKGKRKPPRTPEHAAKIGAANKGRKLTDEKLIKVRAAAERRKGIPLPAWHVQLLREVNTGKHLSEETKKKIGEQSRGRKNPKGKDWNIPRGPSHYRWKGGVNPKYGTDWPKIASGIRERDMFFCQFCGNMRVNHKEGNLFPVHHIIPAEYLHKKDLSMHEDRNLVTLCGKCHKKAEDNLEWSIPYYQELLSRKYGYNYDDVPRLECPASH